jgi:glycosyltransferase involved in cell wall biosynthesis
MRDRRLNVLCLTRYDNTGSSSRYRFYQFLPALDSAGIQVSISPLLPPNYISNLFQGRSITAWDLAKAIGSRLLQVAHARQYELLWIEKELLPWLPATIEGWLARLRIPYVVDYDDATFHQYDRHPQTLVRAFLGRKIDKVMAGAALVTAGNAYLAARAHAAGAKHVELLPTVVDLERYPEMSAPRSENTPFTIGWIGSPITEFLLTQIAAPVLGSFASETSAKLIAIGARPNFSMPGVPVSVVTWSELTENKELAACDVGIMPLTEEPWMRGKCGLKLIQYMASSLPVVGSRTEANSEIVAHNETGFLADTAEDWHRSLQTLWADPGLRQRMGSAGRTRVEKTYSLQAVAPKLIGLFESLRPS